MSHTNCLRKGGVFPHPKPPTSKETPMHREIISQVIRRHLEGGILKKTNVPSVPAGPLFMEEL